MDGASRQRLAAPQHQPDDAIRSPHTGVHVISSDDEEQSPIQRRLSKRVKLTPLLGPSLHRTPFAGTFATRRVPAIQLAHPPAHKIPLVKFWYENVPKIAELNVARNLPQPRGPKKQTLITDYANSDKPSMTRDREIKQPVSVSALGYPAHHITDTPRKIALPPYKNDDNWAAILHLTCRKGTMSLKWDNAVPTIPRIHQTIEIIARNMLKYPDEPRLAYSGAKPAYLAMRDEVMRIVGKDEWSDQDAHRAAQLLDRYTVEDGNRQSNHPVAQAIGSRVLAELVRVHTLRHLVVLNRPHRIVLQDIFAVVMASLLKYSWEEAYELGPPVWDDVWIKACRTCVETSPFVRPHFHAYIAKHSTSEPDTYFHLHTLSAPAQVVVDLPTILIILAINSGQIQASSLEDAYEQCRDECLTWGRPSEHIIPESPSYGFLDDSSKDTNFTLADVLERAKCIVNEVGFDEASVSSLLVPPSNETPPAGYFAAMQQGATAVSKGPYKPTYQPGMTDDELRRAAMSSIKSNVPQSRKSIKKNEKRWKDATTAEIVAEAQEEYEKRLPRHHAPPSSPSSSSPPRDLMAEFGYRPVSQSRDKSYDSQHTDEGDTHPLLANKKRLNGRIPELEYLRYPWGDAITTNPGLTEHSPPTFHTSFPAGELVPRSARVFTKSESELFQFLVVNEVNPPVTPLLSDLQHSGRFFALFHAPPSKSN